MSDRKWLIVREPNFWQVLTWKKKTKKGYYYRPPIKLREGNVSVISVRQSFCPSSLYMAPVLSGHVQTCLIWSNYGYTVLVTTCQWSGNGYVFIHVCPSVNVFIAGGPMWPLTHDTLDLTVQGTHPKSWSPLQIWNLLEAPVPYPY